uniref:Uncharacterized protein n=1 Tax=Arundo donax TaxID=35708 RepID=A0A0A9ABN5_ARUDO
MHHTLCLVLFTNVSHRRNSRLLIEVERGEVLEGEPGPHEGIGLWIVFADRFDDRSMIFPSPFELLRLHLLLLCLQLPLLRLALLLLRLPLLLLCLSLHPRHIIRHDEGHHQLTKKQGLQVAYLVVSIFFLIHIVVYNFFLRQVFLKQTLQPKVAVEIQGPSLNAVQSHAPPPYHMRKPLVRRKPPAPYKGEEERSRRGRLGKSDLHRPASPLRHRGRRHIEASPGSQGRGGLPRP